MTKSSKIKSKFIERDTLVKRENSINCEKEMLGGYWLTCGVIN